MHPELFLLLYQQRERQLEQLHARRAAAAERFELTARTDYGSGTNLATARANLDGTRAVLDCLRPLLTPARYPALAGLDATLDRLQHTLDGLKAGSGWPPLTQLSRDRRERVDADLDSAVEQLADVAAVFDVRRTS